LSTEALLYPEPGCGRGKKDGEKRRGSRVSRRARHRRDSCSRVQALGQGARHRRRGYWGRQDRRIGAPAI